MSTMTTYTVASNSNWGCQSHSLGLVMSDGENRIQAPVFDTTVGMAPSYSTSAHRYLMDGVTYASKHMSWTFEKPLQFGGEYKLWYNENLRGINPSFGEACYDLTVEKSLAESCDPAPLQFSNVCTSTKNANG